MNLEPFRSFCIVALFVMVTLSSCGAPGDSQEGTVGISAPSPDSMTEPDASLSSDGISPNNTDGTM